MQDAFGHARFHEHPEHVVAAGRRLLGSVQNHSRAGPPAASACSAAADARAATTRFEPDGATLRLPSTVSSSWPATTTGQWMPASESARSIAALNETRTSAREKSLSGSFSNELD